MGARRRLRRPPARHCRRRDPPRELPHGSRLGVRGTSLAPTAQRHEWGAGCPSAHVLALRLRDDRDRTVDRLAPRDRRSVPRHTHCGPGGGRPAVAQHADGHCHHARGAPPPRRAHRAAARAAERSIGGRSNAHRARSGGGGARADHGARSPRGGQRGLHHHLGARGRASIEPDRAAGERSTAGAPAGLGAPFARAGWIAPRHSGGGGGRRGLHGVHATRRSRRRRGVSRGRGGTPGRRRPR